MEDHGADFPGNAGCELEFFTARSGDGNAIGCGGKLGEVKLTFFVGEGGNGWTSRGEEKFDARVAKGAILPVEQNDAEGGAGRVQARGRLSVGQVGDEQKRKQK